MCGLYTREINLNPYFLYSQHGIELKVSFLFIAVASASVVATGAAASARSPPDLRRTQPDHRRRTSVAGVPILTGNLEAVPPPWRLLLPLPILKTLLVCLTRPSTLTMLMYTYPLTS